MNTERLTCSPCPGEKLICPWQIVPIMDNFLRPLIHNPQRLFGPYVRTGMTVLDVGCGAGFASMGLAELIGEEGLVISADLQPEMLAMVRKRAIKAGLDHRIHTHVCESNRIGIETQLDFALAFFMLHEVPDARVFLNEVYNLLKTGGLVFLAEPKVHVRRRRFEQVVREAESVGFTVLKRPAVRFGRAVLLAKRAHLQQL
jgi:ubiquinone/menaquinone biosynthesis C-methylase UbiE